MRYLVTYLVYIGVVVRAVAWYHDAGLLVDAGMLALLVLFGFLLFTEPFLTRRWRGYPWLYLALQPVLSIAALRAEPGMDFLANLFIPISFQAVLLFKRRIGFLWIAAFILSMTGPLLIGKEDLVSGAAMVLIYSGVFILMGSYAHLIQQAEVANQRNLALLGELQEAYRQLQDYSAQVEEFAIAQERTHLAQELHDSVTQTIFSMNLTVQAARMLLEKDRQQTVQQIDRLQELANGASGEIQMLVSQLRPHSVVGEGLGPALRRLASERQRRDGLQVSLEIVGDRALPEAMSVGLFRIVQEALNNIYKHAGTCEAFIRVHLECSPAYLEVEDHGRGFDTTGLAPSLGHIGLSGMGERARELGWDLSIDSHPGRGTRVRAQERAA